jgi:3-methylcrotonyl-CoA carboxylase alpha subunit
VSARVAYQPDGAHVTVEGAPAAPDGRVVQQGATAFVLRHGRQTIVQLKDYNGLDIEHLDTGGTVVAPMHGKILALLVAVDDVVRKGDRLAIVEAMKMEHTLVSSVDGRVAEVVAAAGAQVAQGGIIMRIEDID